MQVMMKRDRQFLLTGWVEFDDAYIDSERNGGKRERGALGKTPSVVAVETNGQGYLLRQKLPVVKDSAPAKSPDWAQHHLGAGARVLAFSWRYRRRLFSGTGGDRQWAGERATPRISLGEHNPRQSQDGVAWRLSCNSTQVRPTGFVGARVPIQSSL